MYDVSRVAGLFDVSRVAGMYDASRVAGMYDVSWIAGMYDVKHWRCDWVGLRECMMRNIGDVIELDCGNVRCMHKDLFYSYLHKEE